jgi:hypothetical protein
MKLLINDFYPGFNFLFIPESQYPSKNSFPKHLQSTFLPHRDQVSHPYKASVLQTLHFDVGYRKINDSGPDGSKHSLILTFVNVILFCYVLRCLNFTTFSKDLLTSLHDDFILCSGDEA